MLLGQIKAAAGVYFAVRAFGDGAALFDLPAPILPTANCSVQARAHMHVLTHARAHGRVHMHAHLGFVPIPAHDL